MGNKKNVTRKWLLITLILRWSRRKVNHHWAVEDAGLVTVFPSVFLLSPTCCFFYWQVNFSKHRGFSQTLMQLQGQSLPFAHSVSRSCNNHAGVWERNLLFSFPSVNPCLSPSQFVQAKAQQSLQKVGLLKQTWKALLFWRPRAQERAVSWEGDFVPIGILIYCPSP